jgi:hypothetical protein
VKAAGEGSSSGSDEGGRLTPCPRRCKKLKRVWKLHIATCEMIKICIPVLLTRLRREDSYL